MVIWKSLLNGNLFGNNGNSSSNSNNINSGMQNFPSFSSLILNRPTTPAPRPSTPAPRPSTPVSRPATPAPRPATPAKQPSKPQPTPPRQPRPASSSSSNGNMLANAFRRQAAAPTSFDIFDQRQRQHHLTASNAFSSGGEATAYTLPNYPTAIIKIFKPETLRNRQKSEENYQRVKDMVAIAACREQGKSFLGWPCVPFFDRSRNFIGYAMYRCKGKPFHVFNGGVNSIRRHFPNWTRKHLLLTAIDFVKKVRFLAENHVLINDFNPANFFVDEKCQVSFIDCDSYQIPSAHGAPHITKTYFASHVAPELLRNPQLLQLPRNIHHVEFAAAILVFNIVMCGLHPFAFMGGHNGSNCGSPEENLLQGRCPLGTDNDCRLPAGNWYNLWSWLSFNLKSVFIHMFQDGYADPNARPSLAELEKALRQCLADLQYDPKRDELMPARPKPQVKYGEDRG